MGKSRRLRAICAILTLAGVPAALSAATGDFSCRNTSAEITCTSRACEVNTTGYTPMGVSLAGNRLEICAYSGCSSGALDLRRLRGDHLVVHANLSRGQGSATVVYDVRKKAATLLWGNYALPMSCGR